VIVGLGKEYRDSLGYGTPDIMDAAYTGLGGLTGTITIGITDISDALKKKRDFKPLAF
jgi:hypothetical protein